MLQPERYSQEEIKRIKQACCHVFLSEKALHSVVVSGHDSKKVRYPFIEQLTHDDIKKAYRTNVFTYHPDRHQGEEAEDLDFYARHVEGVNTSYEYLSTLFGARKASTVPCPDRRSRIIAIGGAKGGIGKSLFAANLGTMLASLGFRTVMVDLDLGGSDLHIYLGHKRIPEVTLNDFLNRKVIQLSDAMVGHGHGPMLIAGNMGELGAANIPFQKKMRLIESIQKANADYVILDLGGGTDYNTLDFFLAADLGIVITTLDQSAYVEAYGFIKTALQRKLNRLFSADSSFRARKNSALRELVLENTVVPEDGRPQTIQALLEKTAQQDPVSLPLIADEILGFSPHLVVNHCFDPSAGAKVASTLRSVACERLSVDIHHAGTISKHRSIEQCTSYAHHPIAAKQRSSLFVSEMTSIIQALGLAG